MPVACDDQVEIICIVSLPSLISSRPESGDYAAHALSFMAEASPTSMSAAAQQYQEALHKYEPRHDSTTGPTEAAALVNGSSEAGPSEVKQEQHAVSLMMRVLRTIKVQSSDLQGSLPLLSQLLQRRLHWQRRCQP